MTTETWLLVGILVVLLLILIGLFFRGPWR